MKTTEEPIIVEHLFPVSKVELWEALTDPDKMRHWFFDVMPDFKAEVGFRTSFTLTNEGRVFPHNWEVTAVVPQEAISVQWTFTGYPGVSLVTYALNEESAGSTKLTLTAKVLEDHPADIIEFKRESGVGGWNYFIKEALPKYFGLKQSVTYSSI